MKGNDGTFSLSALKITFQFLTVLLIFLMGPGQVYGMMAESETTGYNDSLSAESRGSSLLCGYPSLGIPEGFQYTPSVGVRREEPPDVFEDQWLTTFPSDEDSYYQSDFNKLFETANFYVYLEEGQSFSATRQQMLSEALDLVYQKEVEQMPNFGSPPEHDLYDKVFVFLAHLEGAGGYVTSADQSTGSTHGNEKDLLYLNLESTDDYLKATAAHEFCHLLEFTEDDNDQYWVKEGIAQYAEYHVFGAGHGDHEVDSFEEHPDVSLTWTSYNSESDLINRAQYGCAFTYFMYIYEKYGGHETISKIFKERENSTLGVSNALELTGLSEDFEDVFDTWLIANYLDDDRIDPLYKYNTIDINVKTEHSGVYIPLGGDPVVIGGHDTAPSPIENKWAANYIKTTYTSFGFTLESEIEVDGQSSPSVVFIHDDDLTYINAFGDDPKVGGLHTNMGVGIDDCSYIVVRKGSETANGEYSISIVERPEFPSASISGGVRPQQTWVGYYAPITAILQNASTDSKAFGVWLILDIIDPGNSLIERTFTPLVAGDIDFDGSQGRIISPSGSRLYASEYTFDQSSYGHEYGPGNYKYRATIWYNGYPGLPGAQLMAGPFESTLLIESTSQDHIKRGLDWLAAKQTKTTGIQAFIGTWGGSTEEGEYSFDGVTEFVDADGSWKYGNSPNAGITALALQAFLNRGYGVDHPVYGETVQKAIDYLLRVQTLSGTHYGAIYNNTQGYETGMAIVALQSALDLGLREDQVAQVQTAIDRAVNYYTQDVSASWSTVSWRYYRSYTSPLNGDMSVNQWVYLALDATDYTDKDIWQKIYGYINARAYQWGDHARLGYQTSGTRPRGNSLAGLWGLALAGEHGVGDAPILAQKMSNYISDNCPMNTLISHPNLHYDCVYSGAGYYYYIYELAKALTLQGTKTYCEENWYPIFSQRIVDQHQSDADGYYWKTGWTDPAGYNIPGSGLGNHGNTALALLSLEVGVVPEGSRFVIRLRPAPFPGSENVDIDGLYLNIYDRPLGEEGGHFAGPSDEGDWFTTIPGSQWNQTEGDQELEVFLTGAGSYTVEIHNDGDADVNYDLDFVVYLPDAGMSILPDEAIDSITFSGAVPSHRIIGTSPTVTSIGGLSLHVDPPTLYPNMMVAPNALDFSPIVNDSTYSFQFTVSETDGFTDLQSITVYATDMTDGQGHTLASTCFNFNPIYIPVVDAGGSIEVSGTLSVPDSLTLNLDEFGDLTGAIVVEGLYQSRLIQTTGSVIRFGAISIAVLENGRGVEGVPVDIYDADNTLIESMCTNFEGCCSGDSIRLGIYSASIVPPLGYLCQQTDVPILLTPEAPDTIEFALTRMNIVPAQRGSSFWRHTVSAAIFSDRDEGDLDEAAPLARYFDLIYQHFQNNRKNPVEIFGEPVPASGPGKLLVLSSLLGGSLPQVDSSIFGDVGMPHQSLAKPTIEDDGSRTWDISDYDLSVRELTALLLNIVSGRLATFHVISEDGITAGQLITYADNLIYNDNEDDDINAYELLYRANYGITINAGRIPSATPNIAYMTDTPELDKLPSEFSLGVNRPNPFNPVTEIGFGLPTACHVTLRVYNILGQLVETLIDEPLDAGMHEVTWNGSNAASGVYLYRIQAGAYTKTRKMVLLK